MKLITNLGYIILGLLSVFLLTSSYINAYLFSEFNIQFSRIVNLSSLPVAVIVLPKAIKLLFQKSNSLLLIQYLLFIVLFTIYSTYALNFSIYNPNEKYLTVAPFIVTPLIGICIAQRQNLFIKILLATLLVYITVLFIDINKVLRLMISASRGGYGISPLGLSSINLLIALILLYYSLFYNKYILIVAILFFVLLAGAGGSKGPLLSFSVAAIYLYYRKNKNILKLIFSILAVFITSVLLMIFLVEYYDLKIFNRLLDIASSSNINSSDNRMQLYYWTVNFTLENNLFFGNGVNSFPNIAGMIFSDAKYPHNFFLSLFFEVGIIPTTIMFIVTFTIFIYKQSSSNPLITAILIFFMITVQFSYDLGFLRNISLIYFIMLFSVNENQSKYRIISK